MTPVLLALQLTTAHASPQDDEEGANLSGFLESVAASNTTYDPSDSAIDGSYCYVILHNGAVLATYITNGIYYTGYNQVFP